ncbi:MAG: restriction endonuclease [Gammaproteobacteria bacterium]
MPVSDLNFNVTAQDVISTYRAVVENVEDDATSDAKRAYGGVVRAKKGELVETMAAQIVAIAWKESGKNPGALNLSNEKVSIPLRQEYLSALSPEIKTHIETNLQEYAYKCKVDLHVLVNNKFFMGIECKSYTEIAMYKRILVDFHLLKTQYPGLHCVLLQLENQLGGDYSETGKETILGSKSGRTLDSYFPDAVPHVITLLEGDRKVNQPIHKPEHYKPLKLESVEKAVKTLKEIFAGS